MKRQELVHQILDAEVKVSGYGKVSQGEKVKLRRHGAKTVSISEQGCEKMTKTYGNTFNATSVVNLPFNFLIGAGIDAATGAMFKPQTGEDVYKIQEIFRKSEHSLNGMLLVIVGRNSLDKDLWVGIVDHQNIYRAKLIL